jgi:pectin methylesterase-like acyl-CoA thioesterase
MRISIASLASVGVLLCGCVGAMVPIQTPEMTSARTADAAAGLQVLSAEQARSKTSLGEVVGYSCKNKLWDPAATAEAATYQVKLAASQKGATAISALTCAEGGVSVTTNCWQSFACKATALR